MRTFVVAMLLGICSVLSNVWVHIPTLSRTNFFTGRNILPNGTNLIYVDGAKYPFTPAGFNSAITDACGKQPGGVVILSGMITFTEATPPISIPSNCSLTGQGHDKTVLNFAPASEKDDFLTMTGSSNVDLGYFALTGTSNVGRGISVVSASNIRLHNLMISGFKAVTAIGPIAGVYVGGSTDVWITDNILTNNGPLAANVDESNDIAVYGTTVSARVHIQRNHIFGSKTNHGSIDINDSTDCDVMFNTIDENNTLGTSNTYGGYGIVLYKINASPLRPRVIGNQIFNTAGSGIYLQTALSAVVSGNTVQNSALQQAPLSLPVGAISLADTQNSVISGNTILNATQDGIVLQANLSHGNGNTITANSLDAVKGDAGIHLIGPVSGDLVVADNTIEGVTRIGIHHTISPQGSMMSNAIIKGNIINAPGTHGILLQGATDVLIVENHVNGLVNSFQGIVVSNTAAGTHNKISGNIISGGTLGSYAINVGSTFTAIDANLIHDMATAGILLEASATDGSITTNYCHNGVRCVDSSAGARTYIAGNRETGVSGADNYAATDILEDRNGISFTDLPTVANGSVVYCKDCTITNPCAAAGHGAIAKYLNAIKVCN